MTPQPLRFSALKQFSKSPAHYAAYLQYGHDPTSGMDIGTAADIMILGGREVIAYPGAVRRGKEYDAFALEHDGAFIITKKEYSQSHGIANAVAECPLAVAALDGARQRTHLWTMNGRECRGTPDVTGNGFLTDLKTSETSDPRFFHWKVKRFAYHAAAAWYQDGLLQCGIIAPNVFCVAVEQAPPHVVTVFRLTEHVLDLGRRLYRLWFELLQVAEASREFPGYAQDIVDLDLSDDEEIDISDAIEVVDSSL